MRYSTIPPIEILAASLRDVHAIHRLEKEIFLYDAYPHLDLAFLFLTPGEVNLKAVNGAGQLVGFVTGSRSWFRSLPAWIVTLGVASSYQRQGIGRGLLLACEDRLARRRVRLTVRKSNFAAIRLYEQCGYQHLYTKPHYYRNGEDGLVMEKTRD